MPVSYRHLDPLPKTSLYYVTCTDRSLNGLGRAKKKISKLIIICRGLEEAEKVENYCKTKSIYKYVSIHTTIPYYPANRYYTQLKTRELHPQYYPD